MAVSPFLQLILLLAALITTTNLHLSSAAETPSPSRQTSSAPPLQPPSIAPPPKRRSSKRRHPAKQLPPPPVPSAEIPSPPPPPTELQDNPLNNIIDALIGSSDFAGWAKLLSSTDPSSIPLSATFFIPTNDAVSNPVGINVSPFLLLYHIVPQRLTFSDLQRLTPNARLPTLLPSKYIVITDNSPSSFTVDDSQITLPDIFENTAFVVHGVAKVLDFSVYGGGGGLLLPPPENTNTPSGRPLRKNPDYPVEMSDGLKSGGCDGFVIVFLTLCYALASKSLTTSID